VIFPKTPLGLSGCDPCYPSSTARNARRRSRRHRHDLLSQRPPAGPGSTRLQRGEGRTRRTGATARDIEAQAAAQSATGRFSQPAEVADLVLYLVSDLAANITGSDFTIDGSLVPTLGSQSGPGLQRRQSCIVTSRSLVGAGRREVRWLGPVTDRLSHSLPAAEDEVGRLLSTEPFDAGHGPGASTSGSRLTIVCQLSS
jgi:hypothetical protein